MECFEIDMLAIIQARTRATRLPDKVLFDLEGKAVLEHVINRAKASKYITDVFVGTTIKKADLKIVKLCAELDVSVFCGSEDDVLDRYYQTARLVRPKHVVRITADCPVIDPMVVDKVIELHIKENADYTSNTFGETYPDGQDVEVFTFEALKESWKNATLASEREHVAPYMRNNPEKFRQASLNYKNNLSNKRWTLDNKEDYELLKIIFKNFYHQNPLFGMNDILDFLGKNPDVERINMHIMRNDGYAKSLREDRMLNLENVEE